MKKYGVQHQTSTLGRSVSEMAYYSVGWGRGNRWEGKVCSQEIMKFAIKMVFPQGIQEHH